MSAEIVVTCRAGISYKGRNVGNTSSGRPFGMEAVVTYDAEVRAPPAELLAPVL